MQRRAGAHRPKPKCGWLGVLVRITFGAFWFGLGALQCTIFHHFPEDGGADSPAGAVTRAMTTLISADRFKGMISAESFKAIASSPVAASPQARGGAMLPPRLAVVIPYVGPELPAWFPLFAASCASSAAVADWIIFTAGTRVPGQRRPRSARHNRSKSRRRDGQQPALSENGNSGGGGGDDDDDTASWLPSNVRFVEVGLDGLAKLHANALVDDAAKRPRAAQLIEQVLATKPYYLVEFKPAVGHVFAPYLGSYSHWAFSDLDLVMGDLPAWADELGAGASAASGESESGDSGDSGESRGGAAPVPNAAPWDVFTYSFGDQFRLYARGQWTVHRNDPAVVNLVYRGCGFLANEELLKRLSSSARCDACDLRFRWTNTRRCCRSNLLLCLCHAAHFIVVRRPGAPGTSPPRAATARPSSSTAGCACRTPLRPSRTRTRTMTWGGRWCSATAAFSSPPPTTATGRRGLPCSWPRPRPSPALSFPHPPRRRRRHSLSCRAWSGCAWRA